jgi:hypothetical protein
LIDEGRRVERKGGKAQERRQGNDKSEEGEAHRDGTLKGNACLYKMVRGRETIE